MAAILKYGFCTPALTSWQYVPIGGGLALRSAGHVGIGLRLSLFRISSNLFATRRSANRNNYKTRSCGAGKIEGERAIYVQKSVANVIHLYILECLTINVYAYVRRRSCFVP
jgi:hypothetical protein